MAALHEHRYNKQGPISSSNMPSLMPKHYVVTSCEIMVRMIKYVQCRLTSLPLSYVREGNDVMRLDNSMLSRHGLHENDMYKKDVDEVLT